MHFHSLMRFIKTVKRQETSLFTREVKKRRREGWRDGEWLDFIYEQMHLDRKTDRPQGKQIFIKSIIKMKAA